MFYINTDNLEMFAYFVMELKHYADAPTIGSVFKDLITAGQVIDRTFMASALFYSVGVNMDPPNLNKLEQP